MKVLHFGAGNIGRGFIGPILLKTKYIEKIYFIDNKIAIINKINKLKKYLIYEIENDIRNEIEIKNIEGILSVELFNQENLKNILQCHIITYSVNQENLKYLVDLTIKLIKLHNQYQNDRQIIIMCCENGNNVSTYFKNLIISKDNNIERLLKNFAFVDCIVDRIVPQQNNNTDNLNLEVEKYYSWICNEQQWPKTITKLIGINYSKNFNIDIAKKLYFLNGLHSALSWHRYSIDKLINIKDLNQALLQPDTLKFINLYWKELIIIFTKKYNYSETKLKLYINQLFKRFTNKYLNDQLIRVGRNPLQKLQLNERIVEPLIFALENNLNCHSLILTLKNGLNFYHPADIQAQKIKDLSLSNDLLQLLKIVTNINNEKILNEIIIRF